MCPPFRTDRFRRQNRLADSALLQIGHGLVHQWYAMIPLRLLLGLFEAGFLPGCVYLISTWYSRYEIHRRFSGFYLIGCLANGFAGVLAFGLMQMVS